MVWDGLSLRQIAVGKLLSVFMLGRSAASTNSYYFYIWCILMYSLWKKGQSKSKTGGFNMFQPSWKIWVRQWVGWHPIYEMEK
jgi:hypothetical protein